MILVAGATGSVGLEICRLLAEKQKSGKALVRSTSDKTKTQELENLGLKLAEGDVKNRSSLDAACQGVTAVISTVSATISRQPGDTLDSVDHKGQINLVDAAQSAGVSHFVYVSVAGNLGSDSPLTRAKRSVENHLINGGITYTVLRPSFFMEVWLGPHLGFDFPNAKARIYGDGENKISWISYRDVARTAVECLDEQSARNRVLELGGPEPLSPLEVVTIFEKAGGRKFQVEHVPEAALQEQKANATDPMQETFAALMLSYAHGNVIEMQETLKQFPQRLTPVGEYARRVLSSG